MNDPVRMHFLAIDPGEKRQGWATFTEDGEPITCGKIEGDLDNFMDWLEGLDPAPKEIIYENYRVSPSVKHNFSKVPTIQLIGMIKRFAKKAKIPLHEQNNGCLPIGIRYIGMFEMYYNPDGTKKKHVDDQFAALAHGTYYMVKEKIKEKYNGRCN